MDSLKEYIDAIHQSKNLETKSSAGDKYETGRAMMQLELDKINVQQAQVQQTYRQLLQIQLEDASDTVRLGSLVTTTNRRYFISVGLGKIEQDGLSYFCISPQAPIGQLLMGKAVGDRIHFNGQEDEILGID